MEKTKNSDLAGKKALLTLKRDVFQQLRTFFNSRDFLEVSTPVLNRAHSGEAYIEPVKAAYIDDRGRQTERFLSVSPEIHHKKLLAAGYERIYELAKCFRNNESPDSPIHSPEFTMLEWYRRDADYNDIMIDCKKLINSLVWYVSADLKISYSGIDIDFNKWQDITAAEAFRIYADIDLNGLSSWFDLIEIAADMGYGEGLSLDDAYYMIFLNRIEPCLPVDRPVILRDYPAFQAAYSRMKDDKFAERFEIYIGGLELANGYSELCDSKAQLERILENNRSRELAGRPVYPYDEEFVACLDDIGDAAGVALGMERLIMLLGDIQDIRELGF